MKNQFVYTRIKKAEKEGEPDETFADSFSLDKVIRTIDFGKDGRHVMLNDFHEEVREVPDIDHNKKKQVGWKRERNTYQSVIELSKEDGDRYVKLINIE